VDAPVLLLAHPRLRQRAADHGIDLRRGAIHPVDPLPYPELVRATMSSAGVVTDSGGLQKEAFLLRVPCTTVRTETEWTETVDLGWNVLVRDLTELAASVQREPPLETDETPYGDGQAAGRAVEAIAGARRR
jgi:UDP-N-acetylglucosamine 2-epimerase (non-hydrolysing)